MKIYNKVNIFMSTIILSVFFLVLTPCISQTAENDIVQMEHTYTYDEMMEDINLLCITYPDIIHSNNLATTVCGRNIPVVMLGNLNAPHSIMIQSTIHAREYLCTQTIMKTIETYAKEYMKGELLDVCQNTCFYIVPMANPDGVSIAQLGVGAVLDPELQQFVTLQGHTTKWKSNAKGVDINRNFNICWDTVDLHGYYGPAYEMWKGYQPNSEIETCALINLSAARKYDCFINLHQRGNIIYYGSGLAKPEVNSASYAVAKMIQSTNGYGIISDSTENSMPSYGTFADYVTYYYQTPSCTIEMGSSLPPSGQSSVNGIYKKNKNVYANVARMFY